MVRMGRDGVGRREVTDLLLYGLLGKCILCDVMLEAVRSLCGGVTGVDGNTREVSAEISAVLRCSSPSMKMLFAELLYTFRDLRPS